jgi:outer membrane lipoprotein-sorting protein
LVEKIQIRFESINTLKAEFRQSANSAYLLQGRFYFKKQNNYRIELDDNTIISDGESIWNIDLKRNKVIISSINDDPLAFSLADYIYNYPDKCVVTEEIEDDSAIIRLNAESADLNFKTAVLRITDDYLISRIIVSDFSGNSFEFEFNDIQVNSKLSQELFVYKPDQENKIIDLR